MSVFPIGERHLKGIDEPERVYELEIEGVEATPAPAPPVAPPAAPPPPEKSVAEERKERRAERKTKEREFERRFEYFGTRIADSIQERVLRHLDKTLAKVEATSSPEDAGDDDEAVDEMATRAASLGDEIRVRVEESLRRSDTPG